MIRLNIKPRSVSTDDLIDFKKTNGFHTVLRLQNLIAKLLLELDQIERNLYKETCDIILERKPLFDKQKRVLDRLCKNVKDITASGLVTRFSAKRLNWNVHSLLLDEKTPYSNWNKLASLLNVEVWNMKGDIQEEEYNDTVMANRPLRQRQRPRGSKCWRYTKCVLMLNIFISVFASIVYFNNIW